MKEQKPKLLSERVVKRYRNGRRRYDPEAKRELVEACLQPGVSVARLALENGLNANLVRKWIAAYQRKKEAAGETAFVPVVATALPRRVEGVSFQARLRNGVEIEVREAQREAVSSLLQMLSRLP